MYSPLSPVRSADEVAILVAPEPPPNQPPTVGCAADVREGVLVADEQVGVIITGSAGAQAVVWPRGFHARRLGEEIEVLGPTGAVVARTSVPIRITGGTIDGERWWVCSGDQATGPG